MKFRNTIVSIALVLFCAPTAAGDIAFGKLKGIKIYDFPSEKVIRLYFDANATNKTETSCGGIATITPSQHLEATVQQMLSVAMSAYVAGKKIRANSKSSGSCEAYFVAMQETYF